MGFAGSEWRIGCIVAAALQTLRLEGENFAQATTLTLSDLPKLHSLAFGSGEQTLKTLVVRNTNLTVFSVAEKTLDLLETLRLESSPIRDVVFQSHSLAHAKSVTMLSGRLERVTRRSPAAGVASRRGRSAGRRDVAGALATPASAEPDDGERRNDRPAGVRAEGLFFADDGGREGAFRGAFAI